MIMRGYDEGYKREETTKDFRFTLLKVCVIGGKIETTCVGVARTSSTIQITSDTNWVC
eukprot:m.44271 g.44271  ORF g.44271 m.44271 type:complete len:58 (-) comp19637_c0_seq1:474-647(-)